MVSIPPHRSQANFGFDDAIKAFLLKGGLPFATVLSEQRITSVFTSVFRKHGCSMKGVYSNAIVLWAFMSLVMRDDKGRLPVCGSYWMIAMFMLLNVHVCFRKNKNRHTDVRKGKRLGKHDHIIQWTFMNLNFVRCMSPEMVRRELWTTLLTYNLIRMTIATAASLHNKSPRQISFVSACKYILASWQEIASMRSVSRIKQYSSLLLRQIASCQVGHRKGLFEPRVVKRRSVQYTLMTQPRNELRRRLRKGDNSFE